MGTFMKRLFVTSIGLWAGTAVFFSGVVLPTLFVGLETTVAGATAALLFPGYYAFCLAVGCSATVAAAYFARAWGRAWRGVLFALVVAMGCQAYAAGEIRPRMSELRGSIDGVSEFQRLHRLSVRLNAVVLLVTTGILIASGTLLERR